jgi:hypothetical protein
MPEALRNDADWAIFQAALDRAAVTLLGRASHAATPNHKGRRRLVISGGADGLERRPDGWWLDPARMPLFEALGRVAPQGGEVAVVGGQGVFELALAEGLAEFHLARARRVRLPQGRGVFAACEQGTPAEAVLDGRGFVVDSKTLLDAEADVTLTIWRRSP